jgi:hypothetical protein
MNPPSEERRIEHQLDVSRDCHTIRDHGKFGSYPSEDDHGDEAKP